MGSLPVPSRRRTVPERNYCESSSLHGLTRAIQAHELHYGPGLAKCRTMRTLLASAFLMTAVTLSAQTVQFGVIGGITVTDPNAFRAGESKRYLIGPSVEARFFDGKVGIELDAIYRRFGNSFVGGFGPPPAEYTGPPPLASYSVRTRTNSWEFPLIGKFYFRDEDASWRPFLGTGYVLQLQWREIKSTTLTIGETTPRNHRDTSTTGPDIGATAVAGVEWKTLGRLSIQPQVRYTRWGNYSAFDRPLNQMDISLGIRF